ncbi:hypothetical protein [Amycolatopsis arida]|uniref:hypothetical protein n=1 Tax=Amycolatopsis arida TaxID=587909 RepID=UPI001065B519|nr:hypothetical protein [Amycolatopsis arida]TDX84936.1 hypothetical protein CLV69_11720 [Amycolatopsis arida]
MDEDAARAAFLRTARRQVLDADTFAGDLVAFFRGTEQEDAARRLARQVAGTAEDATLSAGRTGRRDAELDMAMRRARARAEQFVQQWLSDR